MVAAGTGAQPSKPAKPLPTGVSAQGQWCFEGYTLDESTLQLATPAGVQQTLDRSAFLVLQYLLLHTGQLCSHDELLRAGWPGRRVSSNSLTKCIGRLRVWLDDDQGQRIRLTHGYGYLLALRSSYRPGSALSEPAAAMPKPGEPVPGRSDWRVVSHIGQGGSCEVYAAAHSGCEAARAYKFALGERGLRALKRELALQRYVRLEHPEVECLLPVLDAGLERAPYFLATPLQRQGNLAEWAAAEDRLASLSRESRLAIAQALCDAVAQLHGIGLAHRDLKPQNLYLLASDGQYRMLLADLGAGAGTLPPGVDGRGVPIGQLTRQGQADTELGSDIYLAPELLSGAVATIRSDLYALGVLVFQLAVGDLRRTLAPGWDLSLGDPLLAADLAEAANLNPEARPDSAAVLGSRLRSLEARRQSLQQARVREQVEGELALARAAAARRRRQIGGLGLLVLIAVAGLLLTWQLYRGAEAARAEAQTALQNAEREARTARAVLDFMNGTLLGQIDPWAGGQPDPAVKALLERAAREIDHRFAGEPASALAVHEALADAWEGWGLYPDAMRHTRQALDLLGTLPASTAADHSRLLRKLCRQARMAQQLPVAENACKAGAAIETEAFGAISPVLEVEMAKLAYELGQCDRTLALTEAVLRRTDRDIPAAWRREAYWFRGICHAQRAEFAQAREAFEAALASPGTTAAPGDGLHRAWIEMDYAEMLIMEGDFRAAQPWVDSAARRFETGLGSAHPDVMLAEYQRARMALWSGDAETAAERFRQVARHWRDSLGPGHLWTLYAEAEGLWARAQLPMENPVREAARRELRELRDRALPALSARDPQRSFFAEVWSWTALSLGDFDVVASELARGRLAMATHPAHHPRHALFDCIEADLHGRTGALADARRLLDRCVQGMLEWPPDNYRWRWINEVRQRVLA